MSLSGGQIALKATLHGLALTVMCVALALMHVVVRPFPRKFFCDDQSIRYPKGVCTVPYYVCAPIGVLASWLTVAAAEWGRARAAATTAAARSPPRHLRSLMAFARGACSGEFRARYFSAVLYGVYYFCLGLAACDFLMGMAKNVFGRHRPFFYTICQPEFPSGGCNASVAYDVSICRPTVPDREFLDAQRSFPSGHASFGIYCATFIVLYLGRRGRHWLPSLVRISAQFLASTGGLYVAYSRVPDYKHHWSDILAGGILGACLACAAACAVPSERRGDQRQLAAMSDDDQRKAEPTAAEVA